MIISAWRESVSSFSAVAGVRLQAPKNPPLDLYFMLKMAIGCESMSVLGYVILLTQGTAGE